MSTDYRFTIRRKADDKRVAVFFFNLIKSLYDVNTRDLGLKFDIERVNHCLAENKFIVTVDDLCTDISTLSSKVESLNDSIFEKKLLMAQAKNAEVVETFECRIFELKQEIKDVMCAIEAIAGLKSTIDTLVEELVSNDGSDDGEEHLAYIYNGKDLPSDGEGPRYLWSSDVYVEVEAC